MHSLKNTEKKNRFYSILAGRVLLLKLIQESLCQHFKYADLAFWDSHRHENLKLTGQ